tara:strand:+ start:3273 stop:3467 length:195 start_codon:yes stop_codon:yes gene_type:complete
MKCYITRSYAINRKIDIDLTADARFFTLGLISFCKVNEEDFGIIIGFLFFMIEITFLKINRKRL